MQRNISLNNPIRISLKGERNPIPVNGAMELGMKTKFHCVEGQRAQSQKTPRWCRASKTELKEFQKIKSPKNSATTRLYILNATMKMMQRGFFKKNNISKQGSQCVEGQDLE